MGHTVSVKSMPLCHRLSPSPHRQSVREGAWLCSVDLFTKSVWWPVCCPWCRPSGNTSSFPTEIMEGKGSEYKYHCPRDPVRYSQGTVFHEDQTPASITKGIHGVQIRNTFLQISFIFFQNKTYRVKIFEVMLRRLTLVICRVYIPDW